MDLLEIMEHINRFHRVRYLRFVLLLFKIVSSYKSIILPSGVEPSSNKGKCSATETIAINGYKMLVKR